MDLTLYFLTLPSHTYLYYQHLTSKFDPRLASELVEGKKGQGLYSPGKLETNCLIKLLIFLSKLKITQNHHPPVLKFEVCFQTDCCYFILISLAFQTVKTLIKLQFYLFTSYKGLF